MLVPQREVGKSWLDLGVKKDAMVFALPEGSDWATVQCSGINTWATSAVITIDASLDGGDFENFPDGSITKTAYGLYPILTVTGIRFLRVYVSTVGGSSVSVKLTVNAGRDNS